MLLMLPGPTDQIVPVSTIWRRVVVDGAWGIWGLTPSNIVK